MLSQLTKSTCPRHSRIHLRWNGRECGRFIHQTSSNTETPKVHSSSRAAPFLNKSYLSFIHFIFFFFCTGWPTLTRLRQYSFPCQTVTVRGFNEAAGYFITSSFHCFIHMYLPTGRKKRGKCCMYAHVIPSCPIGSVESLEHRACIGHQ